MVELTGLRVLQVDGLAVDPEQPFASKLLRLSRPATGLAAGHEAVHHQPRPWLSPVPGTAHLSRVHATNDASGVAFAARRCWWSCHHDRCCPPVHEILFFHGLTPGQVLLHDCEWCWCGPRRWSWSIDHPMRRQHRTERRRYRRRPRRTCGGF